MVRRVVPQRCRCGVCLPVQVEQEGESHTCACGLVHRAAEWTGGLMMWKIGLFDPRASIGTVLRVEPDGSTFIELNQNGLAALSEGQLVAADNGGAPKLFGEIPILQSAAVPKGMVIGMSPPDERQRDGLEPYPRGDQWAVVKMGDDDGSEV